MIGSYFLTYFSHFECRVSSANLPNRRLPLCRVSVDDGVVLILGAGASRRDVIMHGYHVMHKAWCSWRENAHEKKPIFQ